MVAKVESWRTADGRFFATEAEARYREAEYIEVKAHNALAAAKLDLIRSLDKHTPTSDYAIVGHSIGDRSTLPIRVAALKFADAFDAYRAAKQAEFDASQACTPRLCRDPETQRERAPWPVRDVPEEFR